ncbi:MAG: DNRLRE domain-containing protein, partial [Chitinivibrionales bacterium]|nr:DNRLRE domain-containing protein [Chitinivibrionales bacterium]
GGKYVQACKHPIRTDSIVPDPAVEGLLSDLKTEYMAANPPHALDEVIGYAGENLTMDKDKWWTMNEYPWAGENKAGGWICDGMVWKAAQLGTPCDLAIQSGGGIRRDVPAGPITYRALYETYPWTNDMVVVSRTGQQIVDYIEAEFCGPSLSKDWLVVADDGEITQIYYQGSPIGLSSTYQVAISEYMYDNENWGGSGTYLGADIREGVLEYTSQFNQGDPLYVPGPRYELDTELAGGFTAVITMLSDADREPYFEAGFVRLLSATPATVQRRNGYGLNGLVNADGSINQLHQMSESMLYRSHLGFKDGALKHGDIIEIWVEGGFNDGNPQLIEQEGIGIDGAEIRIVGNDTSVARPDYHPSIASFFDEWHENHFVRFYAEKTSATGVQDAEGETITVYQQGGFYTRRLPGVVGDILELTGVQTDEGGSRRFRCHTATVASGTGVVGFPPASSIDSLTQEIWTSSPITLTASAHDPAGPGGLVTVATNADAQVVEGYPSSNYGSATWLYIQSASGGAYRDERAWTKFDLRGRINPGQNVQSAKLRLYCWRSDDVDLPVSVHGSSVTSWSESGITWSNQPSFGIGLDTVTLVRDDKYLWYEWDVTTYVQSRLDLDSLVSLVAKPVSEGSSTYRTFSMDSKEYGDGSLAPQLEIALDGGGGGAVRQVAFQYRHSSSGLSWNSWATQSTDSTAPWSTSFDFPAGYGHYEFRSIATDEDGNVESAPVIADARARYIDGVINAPTASNPSPSHGAVDVGLNPWLSVTVNDPDGDPMIVEFYDAATDTLIGGVSDVASGWSATIRWAGLEEGRTCSWYVTVNDLTSQVQSPTWTFETEGGAPPTPVPATGAISLIAALALLAAVGGIAGRRRAV